METLDALRSYVRFLRERSNGYVEFIFSIDDPSLGVELILPRAAYDGFCADNCVHFISDAEALDLDLDAQTCSPYCMALRLCRTLPIERSDTAAAHA